MSYTDDFWNALEEEKKKKKKKNGSTTVAQSSTKSSGDSYTDEFFNELQSLQEKSNEIDNSFLPIRGRFDDEDIAPVKEEDDSLLDFFDAGALKSWGDGKVDWDDVSALPKAILGTAGDAVAGVGKGVFNLAEGFADTVGYGIYGLRKAFGETEADLAQYKKDIASSTADKVFGGAEEYLDQYSVLGRTSNAIMQGVGQAGAMIGTGGFLGGAAGLGSVGTSLATNGILGVSSLGSGMSEAYMGNATDEEALAYGAMSAGSEILFESLFGGVSKAINAVGFNKGLLPLDDMAAKAVSKFAKSQTGKNVAEALVKGGFEGLEELGTGIAQGTAKWLTYRSEEDLGKILEDENLFEQFVVGMLTSDITQAGDVNNAIKSGRDFVTGNTQNEQSVIDKVVEDRIAEAEKDGKKLTGREKNKIQEEVVRDMERGYIDTDTIEEVLGGDSYKSYKDTIAKEGAIKQEFEALKGKQDATLEEQARFREVRREYYRLQSEDGKSQRNDLKKKLGEDVRKMVQNDRLVESYLEKNRVYDDFQADLNKYKGTKHEDAAKKTIENAIKAGANNTNRVHDFVDLAAKTSADTGKVFTFKSGDQITAEFIERQTNEIAKLECIEQRTAEQDAELADMKELLEQVKNGDVVVDGDITEDGIVLNLDSNKPLNRVVGHEITHSFEPDKGKMESKEYAELRDSLFTYAKTKGIDIDSELKNRQLKYKGVANANAEAELVADLVGDFLFTDSDYVKRLSVENRNVFQKMWDEIKYLCKIATAGSKEARELEKVKKAFEDAYRESAETGEANVVGDAKYSLTGKKSPSYEELVAKKATKIVDVKGGIESGSYSDMKTAAMNKATNEGWFDVPHHNADTDSFIFLTEKSFSHAYSNLRSDFGEDTIRCMAHIPEIIQDAVLVSVEDPRDTAKRETKVYTFFGAIDGANGIEPVKLTVKEYDFSTLDAVPKNIRSYFEKNGVMESYDSLYDAHALEVVGIEGIKKESDASGKGYEQGSQAQATSDSKISIADLLNLVKGDATKYIPQKSRSYSLSDSDGRKLSPAVQNRFAKSKVVDEDGNLKAVYHGTASGEFTIFDKSKGSVEGDFGSGFYFTDNEYDVSNNYEGGGADFENKVARLAERIEQEEDIDYAEAEARARDELYKGSHKFEVYLNIENPAIVGETTLLDYESFAEEYNLEDYDSEEDYESDVEQLISDKIDEIIWEVEKNVDVYSTDGLAEVLWEAVNEGGIDIEQLKANINNLYLEDSEGNLVGNEVTRQIIESLGYDGIIDPTVSSKWNMDMEEGTTHYIVFKPNQIKSVTNENPTDNPDIHLSLSNRGEEFAPSRNDFYGRDFRKKSADDIAPVAGTVNPSVENVEADIPVDVTDEHPTAETADVESLAGDRDSFMSQRAMELYKEITSLKKGVRASKSLGYLLDHGHEWRSIKTALLNIRDNPNQVVNPTSAAETVAREMLGREYDDMVAELAEPSDVAESIRTKMQHIQTEIANNEKLREQSNMDYDREIAEVQAEYDAKKNKNTIVANDLLRRIERLNRMKHTNDDRYAKRIGDLEARLEKMRQPTYKTAVQRKAKQNEYTNLMKNLVGDTTHWVDKKLGISYKVNTLRRNLRDVVRDANGNRDIAKADAIYDELQGKYNHNEAELKRESRRIKAVFADLNLNHAEDTYAHMLGEFRHNPDSKLTEESVKEFYEKNKGKIDTNKVDKAIEESRKVFDELIVRVNERLKEQGMKEIPYRQGYFPHFTNPKQGWLAKLFNWKTVDTEIPTSIAGLTETFNPERSWQGFSKQRKGDTTDYSLEQGLDTYIHGALDWIYHIEDIQKRRALENHIRYVHSEEGVKARVDAINQSEELDADEAQRQIDAVYAEANNPLNNFVTNLRAGTNTLANKKSENDRQMESDTNRKIYSVMTNLNNRINANMVVGSFSSALTNFIPITQSWVEVSPVYSLRGMKDTIKSTIRDDGIVNKSDFLTNRLLNEENLYQTAWDKISDKAAFMMEAIDNFTSQTVWRSKYLQNISEGMSETEAIKNADQFAENVIAGRSRGNQPTIFDAKNPITKIFTAFQLEVNNQYGYMFKDAPQDSKNKARLIKGYATAFLGAYAYNALYSSLVGRDAAFDPISILEDLFRDMGLFGDDDDEEEDALLNLTSNILEEVPFVGGLMGGGRIPISSALPYSGEYEGLEGFLTDVTDGNWSDFAKEMLKPLYYLAMPVGGGQIKKTVEGLGMFSDEHPVAGSYTDSGNLRFPVEDTLGNRIQAGLFGQYASENARDYFDNSRSPLKEKQIQEFIDVDIPIRDYWEYREGLADQKTIEDKFDYIAGLDLPVAKKNILINNIVDREEEVDLEGYEDFSSYDEFDFATKKPGEYAVSQAVGGYDSYVSYMDELGDITADKDEDGKSISGSRKEKVVEYINNLDLDYGQKIILFKSMYDSKEDRNNYNADIVEYLDSREDISYDEMVTILTELGMRVEGNNVYWD